MQPLKIIDLWLKFSMTYLSSILGLCCDSMCTVISNIVCWNIVCTMAMILLCDIWPILVVLKYKLSCSSVVMLWSIFYLIYYCALFGYSTLKKHERMIVSWYCLSSVSWLQYILCIHCALYTCSHILKPVLAYREEAYGKVIVGLSNRIQILTVWRIWETYRRLFIIDNRSCICLILIVFMAWRIRILHFASSRTLFTRWPWLAMRALLEIAWHLHVRYLWRISGLLMREVHFFIGTASSLFVLTTWYDGNHDICRYLRDIGIFSSYSFLCLISMMAECIFMETFAWEEAKCALSIRRTSTLPDRVFCNSAFNIIFDEAIVPLASIVILWLISVFVFSWYLRDWLEVIHSYILFGMRWHMTCRYLLLWKVTFSQRVRRSSNLVIVALLRYHALLVQRRAYHTCHDLSRHLFCIIPGNAVYRGVCMTVCSTCLLTCILFYATVMTYRERSCVLYDIT